MKLATAVKITVERFIKSGNFEIQSKSAERALDQSYNIRFGTLRAIFRGRVQFFVAFL